jgi:dTDP-4-amino-4,6-dideoxygalactose transaminase
MRKGYLSYGHHCRIFESYLARQLDIPPEWVVATDSCTAALAAAFWWRSAWSFPGIVFPGAPKLAMLIQAQACSDDGVVFRDVDPLGWPEFAADYSCDLWGRRSPFLGRVHDAAHRFAAPEHPELLHNGRMVCYSFGPQKEISCAGGGALLFRGMENKEIRHKLMAFLNYGYHPEKRGLIVDSPVAMRGLMQQDRAAYLRVEIKRQPTQRARRQKVLETYYNFLGDLLLTKPGECSGHLAVVKLNPEWVENCRRRMGARYEFSLHYPVHPSYNCPKAEELSKCLLTIPCHLHVTLHQAAKLATWILAQ